MRCKSFSDFNSIELKFGNIEEGLNYGFIALPDFDSMENPSFDNQFFLLYRRSEYAAQVELTCAKIFRQLMGYGLEMEIVKEGDRFFYSKSKDKKFH